MVTTLRMTSRSCGSVVLACIAVGIVGSTPRTAARGTTTEPAPLTLNLRLTVSSELQGVSRRALVREAETIWERGPVRLRWLQPDQAPQSGPSLRVLVTPRAVGSVSEGHRWAVGELLRFEGSTAIAVASIGAAQRIVDETQFARLIDLPVVHEHRLGVVLGRAVAHEIGHYLLQTNTHASYGLMRATIDAREFADLRSGAFRLDHEAIAHLAARASQSLANAENPFSYPQD